MTSLKESSDVTDAGNVEEEKSSKVERKEPKELAELPPSGTSLHKRRRGEPPASLSVRSPQNSDPEGSSPCTAGPSPPEDYWSPDYVELADPETLCESMLQRLRDQNDAISKRGKEVAQRTKDTVEALDQLEKLLELLDQLVTLKEHNTKLLRRLKDVNHLKRLHSAHKKIDSENEKLRSETKELELINEALDAEFESEYGQLLFGSVMGNRSMKRSGSKWKGNARFGGSLLRKQRSRSAGGDDSDVAPGTPLRRRSEGIFMKEVEKSKVSKWTRVKAAFRWEKAQWPQSAMGGAAGAVAAGAMVGAVALAGSSPSTATLANPEPRDSASLTPGSALSLTPNSSCEELRVDSGMRKSVREDGDNTFLQAPTQDDSSTSPSPNKLHKTTWSKMKDIIQQTRKESVKKKTTSNRGSKSSPDVVPKRRRSLSDGGDSDAPPALTLTIPSSEELESEPSHPVLRKQRSLELGARPPQHRPPRASKWTKVKRAFLTSASASVPSSPNRHSAFFTDAEGLSSGCEASGVREEIARDYAALQSKLRREFSDRRGKLYAASRPVATEEQLSADFRKKLAEWQLKKGVKQPLPIPARQDLSEDFLKRWDEWKRMKETNSVPAWEEEAKPDEVLVQTSTGLFKFQGISRSFTRKLHEWEKSRGIAPEASTSALLRAAKARTSKVPQAPLTRTQSDGSVAPSTAGSGRLHASSLSVNDADDFDSEYEREHSLDGLDDCDGPETRGAVLVEVEDEEICTAAPLVAVSPRHTPQKPVYTYGQAEARLLCETSSAVTGTAVLQPNGAVVLSDARNVKSKESSGARPKTREQSKHSEKSRRKIMRQPSIEEDAMFIRKTIEEIERGSSSRFREREATDNETRHKSPERISPVLQRKEIDRDYSPKVNKQRDNDKERMIDAKDRDSIEESKDDNKKKESEKTNGKKKTKCRARLEREQSKPSESDTEPEVDTVTVEIPRRRKRPRRASEKPRTPPTSLHSDSEGEIFVLKLKAPEQRDHSPEVIVKTTRKIFSPVVRSGESVPRAVIPVNVEDLAEVRPLEHRSEGKKKETKSEKVKPEKTTRSKSSGDLQETEELKKRTRPPLPSSPSSQRKPQPPKETAPSIRIMIQRYNKKINEEGHTSPVSSGASSPAWRSPSTERRRPPDMPVGVNIRNNPFLEREVQKSASACQLSRRDATSAEKRLTPAPTAGLDGVLKSHSANALHPEKTARDLADTSSKKKEDSQETIMPTASTDTIVPNPRTQPETSSTAESLPALRHVSDVTVPTFSSYMTGEPGLFGRSISTVETSNFQEYEAAAATLSERAAKIRAARERFLASTVPMRREGTSSASDLRPGDRSSRISCESDVTESQSSSTQESAALGRSASTGMVNVDREAWQRVAEGSRREGRSRSRFSLARLAAKLRKRDEGGAVSRLCRQSLLVQLINKH
ncbi:uncharacterized protein LOC118269659 isoform X2 [Spodoptera frugiperda]|uniref:Uncharacterized protein LOC118269659 isoform X2 n=1 Tax=Spodoptera frugiperda TaxID=7108 RepID=A0A9R0D5D9_SPOFR|nr:uncharacterized protein LOC118269659 isoform X2 [Spodoptera frugiperda]